jgi:alcohol dehydrogenase class IV
MVICWFSCIFLLVILIFKGLNVRRLYKSFGVKGLIDNTKQLREENTPRKEKEEGPHLCINTSEGGGSKFTGQPIFTNNQLREKYV